MLIQRLAAESADNAAAARAADGVAALRKVAAWRGSPGMKQTDLDSMHTAAHAALEQLGADVVL